MNKSSDRKTKIKSFKIQTEGGTKSKGYCQEEVHFHTEIIASWIAKTSLARAGQWVRERRIKRLKA